MVSTKYLANTYKRINTSSTQRFPGIAKRVCTNFKKSKQYNLDIRLDNDITRGSQWLKKVKSTGKRSVCLVLMGQPPPAQSRLK